MTQLGDTFSDERRRQGKSIVDVEAATRIRARLLEAIEHGSYEQLPAPAYVKGYIQSYAKYLDIPAQPLLEMYKVDMRFADERESERERPLMPRGARYSKVSRQDLGDLPADPVVPRRDLQHAIPAKTWMIAGGAILTVFLVIWGISTLVASPSPPPPVPTSVQETTTVDPAAAQTSAAVTPVETTGETANAAPSGESTEGITPFKLSFRIRPGEISTLRVTVDGELVFSQKVSKPEEIPSWDVYREAKIVIGVPRWVTTFKDGERIPTPNEDTPYALTLKNDRAQ